MSGRLPELVVVAARVSKATGVSEAALRSGSRIRGVATARRMFCQLAVKKLGYPGAAVARFLGVTTSAVNRAAACGEVAGVEKLI